MKSFASTSILSLIAYNQVGIATASGGLRGSSLVITNDNNTTSIDTDDDNIPTLSQIQMIQAHDAGMALLPPGIDGCGRHKTHAFKFDKDDQSSRDWIYSVGGNNGRDTPLTALLDCGARSLDLRLLSDPKDNCKGTWLHRIWPHDAPNPVKDGSLNNQLYFSHGGTGTGINLGNVICSTTFEEQLEAIVNWHNKYGTETLALNIVPEDDSEDNVFPKAKAALDRHGIQFMGYDGLECDDRPSKDEDGNGYIVAYTNSCSIGNYHECVGFSGNKDSAFRGMNDYIDGLHNDFVRNQNSDKPKLFETQLIWQNKGSQDPLTCNGNPLRNFNILDDLHTTDLNNEVSKMFDPNSNNSKLGHRDISQFNVLKMNNICQHGLDIADAIPGIIVTDDQRDRCHRYCGGVDHWNSCGYNGPYN